MKIMVHRQPQASTPRGQLVEMFADSALLPTGKPLFLPDFAPSFRAVPAFAVRVDRLGKHVQRRYAERYWHHATTGFIVEPEGCDGQWIASFDGSALVGHMHEVTPDHDTPWRWMVNDTMAVQATVAQHSERVNEILCRVSQCCTIKMGDLLYFTIDCDAPTIAIGDRLKASAGDTPSLNIRVC